MKRNYLKEYLTFAPVSLALVRAIECRLLSQLELEEPILDVGCGDGLFASILFDKQIDEGIDISVDDINTAKKRGSYKNLKIADATALPYKKGTFKTVFSNCVLEHILPIDDVLSEVARVLKKDGKLIFTVPSDLYSEYLFFSSFLKKIGLPKIGGWYSEKLNSFSRHYNLYGMEEWDKKLKKAGFKITSCKRYLSPSATKAHEIMLIFGSFSLIEKKFINRNILSQTFRKIFVTPVLLPAFNRFYRSDSDQGSSLLIIAQKLEESEDGQKTF